MRAGFAIFALGIAAVASAWSDGSPAQQLFDLVRRNVIDNIARVPRYTCVETIDRDMHRPQFASGTVDKCSDVIAARARTASPGLLTWHDRLRMDVAIGTNSEMFSWAGASSFESGAMNDLAASGATGSGAFSSFLASVFGGDAEQFRYVGERDISLGHLSTYEYVVPLAKSHYNTRMGDGKDLIIGYHGAFYVVPATGIVRRLEVIADHFPGGQACRVVDTMDYHTVKIGSGEFSLPEVSTMDILYNTGDQALNVTHFSGCREYVGESTIRFDDPDDTASPAAAAREALKSLPPKTRIRVKIDPPVNSETAAAGDPITGVVEHEVKEKGQVVVRTTDRLHGRILQMEQSMLPTQKWTVAIRFDSIERDGVTQPIHFKPLDDGDKSNPGLVSGGGGRRGGIASSQRPTAPLKRPEGAGVFILPVSGKLVLDQKFHSEWETK